MKLVDANLLKGYFELERLVNQSNSKHINYIKGYLLNNVIPEEVEYFTGHNCLPSELPEEIKKELGEK